MKPVHLFYYYTNSFHGMIQAPEVLNGSIRSSYSADVFSLGMVREVHGVGCPAATR